MKPTTFASFLASILASTLTAFLALGALAGCDQGQGTILVTVTASPSLKQVASLEVTAGSAKTFTATPPAPFDLPPEQTLAIVAPASLGSSVRLTIVARDAGGKELGEGAADAPLGAGQKTSVTVTLGTPGSLPTDGGTDGPTTDDGGTVTPIHPLAPISGSTVTSKRPAFRWQAPAGLAGAQVEVCATRDCGAADRLAAVTVDANANQGVPASDLPRGATFWRVTGTVGGHPARGPWWQVTVPGKTAARATVQGPYHDFDGDGQADAITGAINAVNAMNVKSGRAYLVMFSGQPARIESTDVAGALFGSAVASAGDVDGDGRAEALVSAYYASNTAGEVKAGRVYLYKWNSAQNRVDQVAMFDGKDGPNAHTGIGMGPAGDVNGDGYADIAFNADANGGDGRVYVYMGSPTGIDQQNPTVLDGPAGGREFFGSQVTTAGDINGDGYADLAVGAYIATVAGKSGTGRLYLFLGGKDGLAKKPVQIIDGQDGENKYFTQLVAPLGDVNGDGYSDVMAGDNGANGVGRIRIYHGGPDGMLTEAKQLDGPGGMFDFGGGGSARGFTDLNGDGYHDLVAVGSLAGATTRKLYVYLGGPSGITTPLPAMLTNADTSWGLMATPGDMNMDGFGDLIVGASGFNMVGRIFQYSGTAAGSLDDSGMLFTDGIDPGGNFGGSLGRRGALRRRR